MSDEQSILFVLPSAMNSECRKKYSNLIRLDITHFMELRVLTGYHYRVLKNKCYIFTFLILEIIWN